MAQNNRTTLDILTSYRWETDIFKGGGTSSYYKIFTDSTYKTYDVGEDGDILEYNYQYYLSDGFDAKFDNSQLGKVKRGRYIISKQVGFDNHNCYEIIEINDSKLKTIRVLRPGESVLGHGVMELLAKPK